MSILNSAKNIKMAWDHIKTPDARKNTLVKAGMTHVWDRIKDITDKIFK